MLTGQGQGLAVVYRGVLLEPALVGYLSFGGQCVTDTGISMWLGICCATFGGSHELFLSLAVAQPL